MNSFNFFFRMPSTLAFFFLCRSWKITREVEGPTEPPTIGRKQGSRMTKRVLSSEEDHKMYASPEGLLTQGPKDDYARVNKKAKPGGAMAAKSMPETFGPRLLILVRVQVNFVRKY